MGCASSRPVSHTSHRAHRGQHPSYKQTDIGMSNLDDFFTIRKPPPPIARGRSQHRAGPYSYSSHKHYQTPAPSYNPYNNCGKSHAQYAPKHTHHTRDISPPRHRNEMPRRHASHRYRDVSPLGSSRFEQPFERAYVGNGRIGRTAGCNFAKGGVGSWEHW